MRFNPSRCLEDANEKLFAMASNSSNPMPSKYRANSIDSVSLRKHSFTSRDTWRFTAHESGYFFAASGEFFSIHATSGCYRQTTCKTVQKRSRDTTWKSSSTSAEG